MPSRPVIAVILVGWVVATTALLSRDVLPRWLVGPPPDLRQVAAARSGNDEPIQWTILVAPEGGSGLEMMHPVGRVETRVFRPQDGFLLLKSHAIIDSKELLAGTPFATNQRDRFEVHSLFAVEKSGNLYSFRIGVQLVGSGRDILIIDGEVRGNDLWVTAHGPVPLLNWTKRFPYQPRSMVQNTMAPLEFLPGLHVGQRWSMQMISPLTGAVGEVTVEVVGKRIIQWGEDQVSVHEVETRTEPFVMRSWVRLDGMVLRQEVPFPFMKLVLERQAHPEMTGFDRTVPESIPLPLPGRLEVPATP
jgi:hypothetical protein